MTGAEAGAVCCCCFNNEDLFSMLEPHQTFYDRVEIYATIIAECFQIELYSNVDESERNLYMICKNCVFRLRDAVKLRSQVRKAYNRFRAVTKCCKEQVCLAEFPNIKEEDVLSNESDIICDESVVVESAYLHINAPEFQENNIEIGNRLTENDLNRCTEIQSKKINRKSNEYDNNVIYDENIDIKSEHINISEFQENNVEIDNMLIENKHKINICTEVESKNITEKSNEHDNNMICDESVDIKIEHSNMNISELQANNIEIGNMLCRKYVVCKKIQKNKIMKKPRSPTYLFICDVCDRAFMLKKSLRRHMRVHQNDDGFTCEVCDEKFENRDALKAHTILHLNLDDLADPRATIEFFITHRLMAREVTCQICNKSMALKRKNSWSDKYAWHCNAGDHCSFKSIRNNSWFETRLKSYVVLKIIRLWCMSNDSLGHKNTIARGSKVLNLQSMTISLWNNTIREECKRICRKQNESFGGPNVVVEIAEMAYKSGTWVIGGVEKKSKRFFLDVVEEVDKESLLKVIKQYILPGSILISKCWKEYCCLSDVEYVALRKNRTYHFVYSENAAYTENIDTTLSELKRFVPRYVSKYGFDSYVYEFMWRKNLERQGKDLFSSFLEGLRDFHKF